MIELSAMPEKFSRVLVVESARHTRNHYLTVEIVNSIRRVLPHSTVDLLSQPIVVLDRHRDVDLLLVFGGENADDPALQVLLASARFTAVWYTEDPYQQPVNRLTANQFDMVFSNDSLSAVSYGKHGVHLPLAAAVQRSAVA